VRLRRSGWSFARCRTEGSTDLRTTIKIDACQGQLFSHVEEAPETGAGDLQRASRDGGQHAQSATRWRAPAHPSSGRHLMNGTPSGGNRGTGGENICRQAMRLLPRLSHRFRCSVPAATCQSGYGAVCKTVYPGSIPGVASSKFNDLSAIIGARACGGRRDARQASGGNLNASPALVRPLQHRRMNLPQVRWSAGASPD
jgi:hypothetical protein